MLNKSQLESGKEHLIYTQKILDSLKTEEKSIKKNSLVDLIKYLNIWRSYDKIVTAHTTERHIFIQGDVQYSLGNWVLQLHINKTTLKMYIYNNPEESVRQAIELMGKNGYILF